MAAGEIVGVPAVLHDEVRDPERQVRPDYGVSVKHRVMGYIEVKAPGRSIDPANFTGHDKRQWERQKDLPNLLYTNGTQWRLYRDAALIGSPVTLTDQLLEDVGSSLACSEDLQTLLTTFLTWKAVPITSVSALVRAVAPLTRLLRGEVLDQLAAERRAVRGGASELDQPFLGLAQDWRRLLFPQADDATFADGYAQAVTFALLLARTADIDIEGRSLHSVGTELGAEHSLMGKALQLLTDSVAADFKVALDLMVTVIGAVKWDRIRRTKRDVYLYLYEEFLGVYDNKLRQASGTYYTPRELVTEMVRLTEEVITSQLHKPEGFRAPDVLTVDPAMGTGTYLHTILERAKNQIIDKDGAGAIPGGLTELARHLVGFELQMGPYAVAELRIADLLTDAGAALPPKGLNLYVTDTLDDPHAAETQLASGLQTIARSRRRANEVKARSDVTVVIGNPPYHELVAGAGSWVEQGSQAHARGILEDFLEGVPGRLAGKIKNLYVYFYRWATWKVWESTPSDQTGVVCFITTSGYLFGPGFTAMRRYLRQHASDGWIIDLSPEGQTPDVATRIFPGVRQPLAIGLFVRQPDTDPDRPANLRYLSIAGRREAKYQTLASLRLDSSQWRPVRPGWTAPFTAAAESDWDQWPSLGQLLPWFSPGVFPTRTWVYCPSPTTLQKRWQQLIGEADPAKKSAMMKEGRDSNLDKGFPPLPGKDVVTHTETPLRREKNTHTTTVPVGYRAFDRQHVIADRRLFTSPRPPLWAARQPEQVFVIEQHRRPISTGPALVFTHLIPDFHYFKGSEGGRTLPFLHPNGEPNVTDDLTGALKSILDQPVTSQDVLAYIAGVTSHPGFTETFATELETPGVRVPITTQSALWHQAVEIGRTVLWAHTFGEAFFDNNGRPAGTIRYPKGDPQQPLALTPVQGLPNSFGFDADTNALIVGTGRFGPISQRAYDYAVGGRNVLKSWIDYRKAEPAGKRTSPLDSVNPTRWENAWTTELIDVLTVLTRLVEIEDDQAQVLTDILAGQLASAADLAAAGAHWPTKSNPPPRYEQYLDFLSTE